MRGKAAVLLLVLLAGPAFAYDAKNCNGVKWDDKRALAVSKVTAKPRVNFIKSPYDDDFKAAETEACRLKSYLVTGDLVLTGKTRGAFTCVVFQSQRSKKRPVWTLGWLPSTALTPVAPMAAPKMSDWIGTWEQPHGSVEIKKGEGGKLQVEGLMVVPTARDAHTGVIQAVATPKDDTIAFVDDGSIAFDTVGGQGGECRVRMQRVGALLMVEDNSGCGGAGVTFTGLYWRK
jgi:hypothetical protein